MPLVVAEAQPAAPLVHRAWCAPADLPADLVEKLEPGEVEQAIAAASDVLYCLTGRRWAGSGAVGDVTVELRYCWPWSGRVNRTLLELPHRQVTEITACELDGQAIPPEQLRVRGGRWVQRLDVDGAPLPWVGHAAHLTYLHGIDPPASATGPTARLAADIARAMNPTVGTTSLPSRVRSMNRQNVDIVVLDPFEFLDKGRTGIAQIDLWLVAVNPHRQTSPSTVWSPDLSPAQEF